MRNLFYILLAAAVLIPSRGHTATESKSLSLSFYIVSDGKIAGGRYMDTPDFPKLGYIASKPDLVITQLMAVTPLSERNAIEVTILPEDAQKLTSLTEQNIGKKVLLMLRDVPLMAPRVNSPISTTFELTIGDDSKRKKIEEELKKLVR